MQNNNVKDNQKIIENIKWTLQIEGCNLQENDINLMNSFLNNEITEMQGIEKIKRDFLSLE